MKVLIPFITTKVFQGSPSGCKKFKCTKTLSQRHLFLYFLPSKDTFMNDYDGIYNCNSLKYSPTKNFDKFWFIIIYGDQNIG
jgi:hypothetical protein